MDLECVSVCFVINGRNCGSASIRTIGSVHLICESEGQLTLFSRKTTQPRFTLATYRTAHIFLFTLYDCSAGITTSK